MKNLELISFFVFSLFFNIKCYDIQCSSETDGHPSSAFHCSGLNIKKEGDSHCCLWKFYDKESNTNVSRCSSISESQYINLHEYIYNKTVNYSNLDIQCSGDQRIYCSNILFDQEYIPDCRKLPVSDKKDKFCCRWKFKDNTNDGKKNSYCASINEYQYLTIKHYVDYKKMKGNGRYDKLKIDCFSRYITRGTVFYILLLFVIL